MEDSLIRTKTCFLFIKNLLKTYKVLTFFKEISQEKEIVEKPILISSR